MRIDSSGTIRAGTNQPQAGEEYTIMADEQMPQAGTEAQPQVGSVVRTHDDSRNCHAAGR